MDIEIPFPQFIDSRPWWVERRRMESKILDYVLNGFIYIKLCK